MLKICWMKDFSGCVISYYYNLQDNIVYSLDLQEYEKQQIKLTPTAVAMIGPVASFITVLLKGIGVLSNTFTALCFPFFWIAGILAICFLYKRDQKEKEDFIKNNAVREAGSKQRLWHLYLEGKKYRLGLFFFCLLSVALAMAGLVSMRIDAIIGGTIFLIGSYAAVIWLSVLSPIKFVRFKMLLSREVR